MKGADFLPYMLSNIPSSITNTADTKFPMNSLICDITRMLVTSLLAAIFAKNASARQNNTLTVHHHIMPDLYVDI